MSVSIHELIPFSRWTRETKLFLFASFSLLKRILYVSR
nr:MAG TPA: hypothetical protein [Caudoviricetes sp.]